MVAYEIIERLEALVSKFLNKETYTHSLSYGSLKRELDTMYENSTKGIVKDLENDYDFLFQQDCDITIDGFKQSMRGVQERVVLLKTLFEEAKEMPSDGTTEDLERMSLQKSFCERMMDFIDSLIEKVREWSESALTKKEADDCFFEDVRFDEKDLPLIYNNLINHQWIVKSRTSLKDFVYLFSGTGFRPASPVIWRKTEDDLCLFLEEMTIDAKDLTKAALTFEKRTRRDGYKLVKQRQLSAVRTRLNNKRPFDKENKLKVMYRDIFEYPNWKELANIRGFENFNEAIIKRPSR